MNIGFDIDDVLAKFMPSLLSFATPYIKMDLTESQMVYTKHYGEIWGVSLEQAIEIVTKFYNDEDFVNIKPNSRALKTLTEIKKLDHEIFIITSRPEFVKDKTELWIKKEFGDLIESDHIFYTSRFYGEKQTKGEICKKLSIDYFVDDDQHHIKSCSDNKIATFMIDKPWNRMVDMAQLTKRIYQIDEILPLLQ